MQPAVPHRRSLLSTIFLSPEEPRLRAGWRILGHSALILIVFALASLLLVPLATIAPQYLLLAGYLITGIAITLATFLARRWLDHRSFTSLGLHWNRQALADLAAGISLSGLMLGLVFLIEWAFGWLQITSTAWMSVNPGGIVREMFLIFLAFVFVGWQEELLSRGYWLQNLEQGLGLPLALVVSSILFALGHLANPNISLLGIVGLTAAGLFMAYGYLVTRQLWLPIGLHIGWNFFEGPVLGFPVSGTTDFLSLLNLNRTGGELLTGGAFGPEAGLIQYPILLLGLWIMTIYSRRRPIKS
jgi:uncharacterized protein